MMGMYGHFRSVRDLTIAQLSARPDLVTSLLFNDGEEFPIEDNGESFTVDKLWHVLHYLLTGRTNEASFPLGFIMGGGREVGRDLGYGPAHAFLSGETHDIADALDLITPDMFARRFDDDELTAAGIYLCDAPGNIEVDEAVEHYRGLRDFVCRTADANRGLLVYVS